MKILIYLSLLFIFGCDNNNSIRTYSIPKQRTIPLKNTVTKSDNQFNWSAPSHWEQTNISPMRLASYNIPYDAGNGDLSVTNFSGDGGGLLANVNRWRGQLDLSPLTIDKLTDEVYLGQSSMGEYKMFKVINLNNESTAFLCSIFEIGKSTVFIKLVASLSGINQLEEEFKVFCSSFIFNDK